MPEETAEETPAPDETVLLDVEDGVATVTLNRPRAMNSLDVPTKELLLTTLTRVADDAAVRCVVLTGSGRAFCTGQDLREHVGILQARDAGEPGEGELFDTVAQHYNPLVTLVATMDKPVLAAVNGVAAGAGMSLSLACDLRLVADTAGFNTSFAGVGLSCDTGSSYHLARLVGHSRALELLYLPRTVDAQEALELGLASRVVPAADLASETADLARRLAAGPTVALGSIRRAVGYAASHTLAEALEVEREGMARTGATADHRAAVSAFLAKERPVFEGR